MITVLSVFGTRPEAIKMAPVIAALNGRPGEVSSITCATGQHDEMLQQVLRLFDIRPDFDFHVMKPNQGLAALTAALVEKLDAVVEKTRPDWVLAQGDTTTVFVAALVSYYRRIPFGHVEAGLRTHDKGRPFPEEMNRRLADCLSDLYFAPTARARRNLLCEGFPDSAIVTTGNTVVDALQAVARIECEWSAGPLASVPDDRRLVLVTAHRRESFGEGLKQICLAVRTLALELRSSGVHFVFPVHLNPNVQRQVHSLLGGVAGISLLEPIDYLSLVQVLKRAELVLTDSGGIQEEAPTFRVPVLVMRETTERPEGVEAGVAEVVGTSHDAIVHRALELLSDRVAHARMTTGINPYGDGRASSRIVDAILNRTSSHERTEARVDRAADAQRLAVR